MKPRKRFGQHFLHDPAVIERIVASVAPERGQHLVEIGPGRGAITMPLLRLAGEMDAVELDRDLAAGLDTRAEGAGVLRLHVADALEFDFCELRRHRKLRLVGNLPYNISTPLLFALLRQKTCIDDMHFMLQREVVDRMIASPGSKTYGRLTVMLGAHCRVERLFGIGRGAFTPPPKVDSAFVRLKPHAEPPFPLRNEAAFAEVVRLAFSHRRKTMRNAVRSVAGEAQLRKAGIDPSVRPETLSPAEFARLSDQLRGECSP